MLKWSLDFWIESLDGYFSADTVIDRAAEQVFTEALSDFSLYDDCIRFTATDEDGRTFSAEPTFPLYLIRGALAHWERFTIDQVMLEAGEFEECWVFRSSSEGWVEIWAPSLDLHAHFQDEKGRWVDFIALDKGHEELDFSRMRFLIRWTQYDWLSGILYLARNLSEVAKVGLPKIHAAQGDGVAFQEIKALIEEVEKEASRLYLYLECPEPDRKTHPR